MTKKWYNIHFQKGAYMHYLDLREQAIHGTPDFPFAFYRVQEGHPRYDMPFHWHKEWELIRILDGSFTCCINGEQYPAEKGDYLLITHGALHGGTPQDCVYECAVFDPLAFLMHPESCRSLVQQLYIRKSAIPPVFKSSYRSFSHTASKLFSCAYAKGPGWELSLTGTIFELFGLLWKEGFLEQNSPQAIPDADRAFLLKPVLEYIDKHYMQPVTLEELARLTGMSPRYFCRFFNTFIHRTPIDYLNYYRIEVACSLLASTQLSVTETAYRCGFNDSSYFVKIFKKYKGVTPLQYRRSGLPE